MKVLLTKIKNRLRSYFISPNVHKENAEFRAKFGNYKQAVILGSGPSINRLDVSVFKDSFVITMGNFFEHPDIEKINPKIHVFAATHIPITKKVLSDWWGRCHEVLPKQTPILVERRDEEIAKQIFIGRKIFVYSYGGSLPVDFTKKIMSPWSVTIVGLQLAIYCKIPKIVLLGINHDWQNLSPYEHFYSHSKPSLEFYLSNNGIKFNYPEILQRLSKERLYKEYELYQQYESIKREAESFQLQIVNGDPFSHFDVFQFDRRTDLIINQ